jgi:A/G-specific adenine glycosylase
MPVDGLLEAEQSVAERLLDHYRAHARVLPWRAAPGTPAPDPYRVWLSEIMLQQTTVAAVIPYFQKFTSRWPTVRDLADADEAELMAAWAGLGYYARARNLRACGQVVANEHGGRFPADEATLLTLPGVGAYTAAAISSIAFGRRAVVVDGNVERVVSRLFAVEQALPGAKPLLRQLTDRITPTADAGDFAQAMMDLGATICSPRNPDCSRCPISLSCRAYESGEPGRFPVKAPKKAKPTRTGIAWWLEADGHVWLVRRPEKGLLGGMMGLPSGEWREQGGDEAAVFPGNWQRAGVVRHVFTHFALELGVRTLRLPVKPEVGCLANDFGEGQWWPIDRVADAGLPTVFARAATLALAQDESGQRELGLETGAA